MIWIAQGALLAVLSSSRLMSALSPFAVACFAAALDCGWPPLPMLAGCLVHALAAGWSLPALTVPFGCLLVWGLRALERRFLKIASESESGKGRRARRRAIVQKNGLREVFVAAQAGLGVLVPGLAVSGGLTFNGIMALLSAVIAALLAPAVQPALALRPFSRRRYLSEERLSAALMALMLLIALGSSPFCGLFLAQCAAALLTLVCASQGAGAGAAGGVACAAALALGTGLAPAGQALALGGLLAGCVMNLPRPAAALALMLGNALALTQGVGFTPGRIELAPLLLGCALYCVIPAGGLAAAARLIRPETAAPDSLPARRACSRRLNRLARVFETLSDGYRAESPLPDEGEMIARLRQSLCEGCADYPRCWAGDCPEAGRLMCRLISEALSGRCQPLFERPPELIRHCRRSAQIDRRLGATLLELAERCRTTRERGSMKAVVSGQLRQAAAFLDELSRAVSRTDDVDPVLSERCAAALEQARCPARRVTATGDARPDVLATLEKDGWTKERAQTAAQALSRALGCRMVPLRPYDQPSLRFLAAPRLHIRAGLSVSPLQPNQPCGDTAHIGLLPDGRLLAVLSDGMGSGERAAAESRRTIRLIRTFLEAGLDSVRSLEAINALLQLQSGELFATVDLCLIDLQSGEASLSKLGACSSLLLSGGRTRALPGGHLPIGILEKITPGEQHFVMRPGDTLILCSDGVADDLREGQAAWLAEQALALRGQPPQSLAQSLRQAALDRQGGVPADDMSVMVLHIDRRGEAAQSGASAIPPEASDAAS
ncbi:MAG: SpoIIE family protein phosphatase [Clostridiales bacterium]|nr:SpoIIE family protein phosphatase [Clostridiales bacterium]